MNKDKKTDEEEIILPPYTGLRRVYTYQPYTVQSQKDVKRDRLCAKNINQGYKANEELGMRIYRIKRFQMEK